MNVTKESSDATEVTFNIELGPEDEEPFITRSYRKLVTRVQIPGFRRGKAPRSILESHLGRAALVREALEFMVPETLDRVLKEEDLSAFGEPELEILDTEPVAFKAVVPLEPLVDLGDFRQIRLQRQPVEVTDEQVNGVIEKMRFDAAPWEPAGRPVKFGDLVSLDVKGTIEGNSAIDDHGVDFVPQQDNPLPIPGFSVYLEGMSEGQEKEFTLAVPEDFRQANYAGKECRIQVRVLSVKEKKLPELDDEFAKGVRDGYESLEALTADVRRRLTEAAEQASLHQLERDSLEELTKRSNVQASDLIYQRELEALYEEREQAVRNQRLDMDTYLSYIGKTAEEWRELLKPRAEERLKTFLILRKLAQEEGIDVSTEEIQAEIESIAAESTDSEEAMRRALSSDSVRGSIRSSLLNRKVIDRLVEIVEGTGEEAGTPDAGEEPEPGESQGPAQQEGPSDTAAAEPDPKEEGADPHAE